MPSVSHSEVESYLLCRRRHFYSYTQRLQRVTQNAALATGSAGHEVLDAFYGAILEFGGNTHEGQADAFEQAVEVAKVRFEELVTEGYRDTDDKRRKLYDILFEDRIGYFANEPFVKQGWQVLASEMEFRLRYDEEAELDLPFKVDLIVRDPEGKTVVVDHKFVWDFYSYEASELQPQIPKYIGALRALNYKIDYGFYNMLRTRNLRGEKMLKPELVDAISTMMSESGGFPESDYDKPVAKMTVAELSEIAPQWQVSVYAGAEITDMLHGFPLKPNSTRVVITFKEQIETARTIQAIKDLSPEEQDAQAVRVANKMVCQSCSFRDLCISDLNGANSKLLIQTEYMTRPDRDAFDLSEEMEEVS